MTREEAEKCIKSQMCKDCGVYLGGGGKCSDNCKVIEAIKALKQEPSEDCISRLEALYLIADYDLSMGQVVKGIHALPSVTPQPKSGKWIEGKYRDDDIRYNDSSYKCNKCGMIVDFKENYCPDCGAKMIEN